MKTTKMFAKIMSVILAGMMAMGLVSCGGKADKVEGNTYTLSAWGMKINFIFDADGTGRYYDYSEEDNEYRWSENGDWKSGNTLPEKFTSFKWKQDKKSKKVICFEGDNYSFEYSDASISIKLVDGSSDIKGKDFIKQ